MSISEQWCTYPSPDPTIILTCCHLTVFWVRGGVGTSAATDIDSIFQLPGTEKHSSPQQLKNIFETDKGIFLIYLI